WAVPAVTPGVPENDAFADAIPLRVGSNSFDMNTVGATKELAEPSHAGNAGGHALWRRGAGAAGGHSLCLRWTAPRAGTMTIDTHGSLIDTLLAVYTGSSVSSLTQVASNDNVSTADTTSKVTFSAAAGGKDRTARA